MEAGFDECSPDGDGEKGEDGSAEDKRDDEEGDKAQDGDEEPFAELLEVISQRHGRVFEEAELVEWAWDRGFSGCVARTGWGVVGTTGSQSQRLCPNVDGAACLARLVCQRQWWRAVSWMNQI